MTRNEVKAVEQKKTIETSVQSLQKANADVTNRFEEIEQNLRQNSGQIEVLENRNQQSKEALENLRRSQDEKISTLQEQVRVLQQELVRLESEMGKLNATIESGAAQKSVEKTSSEKEGSFEVAENFFANKEWKKAILSYNKYRDSSPKGKKFAEATYKIGVCFQELGLKDEARSFYDEVIAKFSSSPEARKSKTRLKGLK
jgi:TolA-binding protein